VLQCFEKEAAMAHIFILSDPILPSYSITGLHNILIALRYPSSLAVKPRRLRPERMRTEHRMRQK
jgi:hypothetical protein